MITRIAHLRNARRRAAVPAQTTIATGRMSTLIQCLYELSMLNHKLKECTRENRHSALGTRPTHELSFDFSGSVACRQRWCS